jgi:hypothetical protein
MKRSKWGIARGGAGGGQEEEERAREVKGRERREGAGASREEEEEGGVGREGRRTYGCRVSGERCWAPRRYALTL